ncbi:ATP-dependent DNA ligase [Devosia yakushimensis]|uniref:DNA ligase (ATP) n=1 Tax=Devosia yakushimensis TaxID=470028 RepID=A0ABQ5UCI9_9HYPH|nr:DNA ligase D [Devosia yakushimensis]GLQ09698.1 ATP-dependent DNA ligase [Devosia yakushimensis]
MASEKLQTYRRKRDFSKTTEPVGAGNETGNRFVVHKHSASSDHYDLRLELDGVLKSWAVPKGPSLNPADKRLAAATEDHPLDYFDFEGVIPEGEYGGGPMIVWDWGVWAPMGDPHADLEKGSFKFRLAGEKLNGGWMLTRLKGKPEDKGRDNWLLFKERDPAMDTEVDILKERPESVKSGRRIEELVAPPAPVKRVKIMPGKAAGAIKGPMPDKVDLQLATAAEAPPKDASGWLHEIKFDGYRTLAFIEAGKTRLITRGGLDWTRRYGDLPEAFAALDCKQAVIDGEIVVLDDDGISRFGKLQDALAEGASHKLVFYAFDLLYLDGWDLRGVELTKRKTLLAQLLAGHINARSALHYSDHMEGDAGPLYGLASEKGLEGIVAKRAKGTYQGGRSPGWLKVKALKTGDFVIAGYTDSEDAGGIGALGLAEWVDGELHYRGKVGTGFDASTMRALLKRLAPMRIADKLDGAPPDVLPVRPTLTARIQYATMTTDGLLRHSVFKGLREVELTTPATQPRKRIISDADLAGIWVTNPTRRLFGKSGPTKLDIAVYYAAVGDYMLPHLFNRPVSLFRCPSGSTKDCFFQRHAFTGMPPTIKVFETKNSDDETRTYISVEDAKGYLALAQFGVVEFHVWGTHERHLDKPDRVIFDLDPGEGVEWRDVVNAAVHLRGELEGMGLAPFVKTSGGRGVHIVVPIKQKLGWKQVHQASSAIASRLAATGRDTFVTLMGAENRKGRIFIDFYRNARSATAVAAYSLRARPHLPASTPIDWRDLESIDSPLDLNYSSLPGLLTTSGDPWAEINESARDLPA